MRIVRELIFSIFAVYPPLVLMALSLTVTLLLGGVIVGGLNALVMMILTLDAAARHREYGVLRSALQTYERRLRSRAPAAGVGRRVMQLIGRMQYSWCSRQAAHAACCAEGYHALAWSQFRGWGYRPWHLFPKGTFTRQSPFLKLSFWRAVIGMQHAGQGTRDNDGRGGEV